MKKPLLMTGLLMLGVWLVMLGYFWMAKTKWYDPLNVWLFWSFGIASTGIILTGLFSKS